MSAAKMPGLGDLVLGRFLELGSGIGRSMTAAVKCYERAAVNGDCDGMNCFGLCFEFGKVVCRDPARAFEWYLAAAEKGDPTHGHNLAFCLEHGIGVDVDLPHSARRYKLAGDTGSPLSRFHYALCQQFGIGLDPDFEAAAAYYGPRGGRAKGEDAFRCRRAQNRATFSARYFPEFADIWWQAPKSFTATSQLSAAPKMSDLLRPNLSHPRGPIIGHGGNSIVTRERDPKEGRDYAIKRIISTHYNQELFLREVEALTHLTHPCVVSFLGWALPSASGPAEIRTEYAANRSLEDVLKEAQYRPPAFWTPTGQLKIIFGIVLGMRFIHSRGYIHSDLKPSNILIDHRGLPLISDFGSSRLAAPDHTLTPETGTVYYAAPELCLEEAVCTAKVDVFSFGSILYEILTGLPVFPMTEPANAVLRKLLVVDMPDVPARVGSRVRALIKQCWSHDPERRPSFDDILKRLRGMGSEPIRDADLIEVSRFIESTLQWEARNPTQ
jgi:tRNA A-37 threonylcarbamoyl transferase component Bud32